MEVLLGLLAIESMSGYDLGQMIRGSVRHFWNESYGQIYPNLKELARGGFVRCKTERQRGKPDRRVYSITEKGRERLREWLAVPPQPEIPRNELLLKLFFGQQVDAEILIGYVEHTVEEHRAVLDYPRPGGARADRGESALSGSAVLENGRALWAIGDEGTPALGRRDAGRAEEAGQKTAE